jgi:hypothetical protein
MGALANFSYFVALAVVGGCAVAIAFSPVMTILPDLAVVLGLARESQDAKHAAYAVIFGAWAVLLVALWVRHGRLLPVPMPGDPSGTRKGQALVAAGHGVVLSVAIIPAMQFLMILPVLLILALYIAGIVQVERYRRRVKRMAKPGNATNRDSASAD